MTDGPCCQSGGYRCGFRWLLLQRYGVVISIGTTQTVHVYGVASVERGNISLLFCFDNASPTAPSERAHADPDCSLMTLAQEAPLEPISGLRFLPSALTGRPWAPEPDLTFGPDTPSQTGFSLLFL